MYSVNVGFKTSKGTIDETQMDIREIAYLEEPLVELEVTD